jgi:hypothetical protein
MIKSGSLTGRVSIRSVGIRDRDREFLAPPPPLAGRGRRPYLDRPTPPRRGEGVDRIGHSTNYSASLMSGGNH